MPVNPSVETNSTIVRSANGACRPYELRRGGSAIAIGCSFISLMRMRIGRRARGPCGCFLGFAGSAARVLEPRLVGFRVLALRLADHERAAALIDGFIHFFFFFGQTICSFKQSI